jgi:hypothetical protein
MACQNALIQDDPYQFEQVPDLELTRNIERLEIRAQWVTLNSYEASALELMRCEVMRREKLREYLHEADRSAGEVPESHTRRPRVDADHFGRGHGKAQKNGL